MKYDFSQTKNQNQSNPQANNFRIPGMKGPRNRSVIVEKPKDAKGTLLRLINYFSKERRLIIALLFDVCMVVICSLYAPRLQSNAIDVIVSGDYSNLLGILIILAVVYIFHGMGSFLQTRISARLSQRIVRKLRQDLFHKIVRLPVGYIDRHSHGDIMSRMTNDIENISNTIAQSLSSLFSGALMLAGTVFMMMILCWQLGLLSCITVIITVVTTKSLSKIMKKYFSKRQTILGELNGCVEQMVTGYKTVVAYNRQNEVIGEFDEISDRLKRTGIIAGILGFSMGPVMNVINNIGFVIIAAFGGMFALKGMISIGIISAFIVYAKQFSRPIDQLAQIYGQIQTAVAGAERVFAVLDIPNEDKSGVKNIDDAKGNISFKNVCFSYEKDFEILHNITVDIHAGEKVAIVGATGSGKTTLVNLLMRFYDIDKGEILIDGINIKDVNCDNLRKNMAIVLQNAIIFSDTVANNIRYANNDADEAKIKNAASMSNCSNMIEQFVNGYDTFLTGAGANISQGQKQLITIARAFMSDCKILILDEATSSVDTRTEKHIQDACARLMDNKTSIIIAHRLSTIRDADKIIVLDKGKIVETGNHIQLLIKKGKYYELYMTQFEGKEI